MTLVRSTVAVLLVLGAAVFAPSASAARPHAAAGTPGSYVALSPSRILPRTSVASNSSLPVSVPGVPAGASAVLNVTATAVAAPGFVTVYTDGTGRPGVSNLNVVRGQTVPNLVVVRVSTGGKVDLFNGTGGSMGLIADLSGYFVGGTVSADGGYVPLATPTRILDTRHSSALPKATTRAVPVASQGGIPAAGVSALILNLTATQVTGAGYVTAYGAGSARPEVSNLNLLKGQTVPNLAVVPVNGSGPLKLYNGTTGSVQLLVDVAGYILGGAPSHNGLLGVTAPVRILDTRQSRAIGPNGTLTVPVSGHGSVPRTGVAATVLNVTVTGPTAAGYLAVYPAGTNYPGVSNVNFSARKTVPNLAAVRLGSGGALTVKNGSAGSVQVILDVQSYVLSADLPVPAISVSRYVRDLSGGSADAQTMSREGCADAGAPGANHLMLLDIGAQTTKNAQGTVDGVPRVLLTATSTRLTLPQLVTAMDGYLDGYAGCRSGSGSATVAVSTNTDGDFGVYPPASRGADWATKVITPLQSRQPGITVVGADDIEANFDASEAQVEAWISAYVANSTGALVFNGAAAGCPTTIGTINATCQPVALDNAPTQRHTWTQANYYAMSHGLSNRLMALPQVYFAANAIQWANIARSGSAGSITFLGSLTEHAANCGSDCALAAEQGWALLYQSLSVAGPPSLPYATDLQIDT